VQKLLVVSQAYHLLPHAHAIHVVERARYINRNYVARLEFVDSIVHHVEGVTGAGAALLGGLEGANSLLQVFAQEVNEDGLGNFDNALHQGDWSESFDIRGIQLFGVFLDWYNSSFGEELVPLQIVHNSAH